LRFPNPYNGDLNQVRGKSFVIEFEQTSWFIIYLLF
jgi:hypothetical protein